MPEPISNGEAQRRWRERHKNTPEYKAKKRDKDAAWKIANPERNAAHRRKSWLKCNYGITPETYDDMRKAQNFRCAICLSEEKLYVDHCHSTDVVRGLLCHLCNASLGGFKDNTASLARAIEYLECKRA